MRYYYHLKGRIELEKENFSRALGNLKKAIALLPFQHYEWHFQLPMAHSLFLESLAFAYYKSNDFEAAQEEYEKIINLTIGKLWYGDIFASSFYRLAKVFERMGERGEAIKHYEKFLTLLKNADPGNLEVVDAKKRLTALKGQ